uniref:EGF-like domain-containing protein n=1 Tax=Chromera velia CCMP2878 TaxID=1169474 RepID=A0A0G4FVY4_9ALVE|eukprot:Cvel_19037.t1-p1 / transcript=Cvel_19037.t1 / gene=Cvel_19037 / organism=Chromera_velia_CCMP2878 / gene_product=Fibrillin-1, putative / transcript_product=Fibrillin-1, putative / location=Cvel_scaffold1613:8223-15661(+) / protein_length=786 / sequence_SO=supercontig / SO=protein_coding / is_pseudo=false
MSWYVTSADVSGTSAASDSNVELILELPCFMNLYEYSVVSRSTGDVSQNPSKAEIFGSNDLTSWTSLGSFSGETSWVHSETKSFFANGAAGPFKYFKFVGQRVNSASDARLLIADVVLTGEPPPDPNECNLNTHNCHGNATCNNTVESFQCSCMDGWMGDGVSCSIQVPPSDIGSAPSWTKDGSVTFGGFHTFSKDYASGECTGTYRVRTDTDWFDNSGATGTLASNEWPPSGAFDNTPGGYTTQTGWAMANSLSCSQTVDCNVQLILETPCSLAVSTFWVQAETGGGPANTPSAMVLSGSSDEGVTWTELGSFSGETGFASSEVRNFTANAALGVFNWFKFFVQRSGQPSGSPTIALMSGVGMYGAPALQCNEATDPQPNSLGENLTRIDGGGQTGFVNDTAIFQYACGNNSVLSAPPAVTFTCTADAPGAATWKGTPPNCTALAATSLPLPPVDIGQGDTWTKDASVTYGGRHTFYKDRSTGICAGRYRVSSNCDWINNSGSSGAFASNERPPSGAFDHILGGVYAYPPNAAVQITTTHQCSGINGPGTADCDIELILEIPCSLSLYAFGVTAAAGASQYRDRAPGKAEMLGSSDGGSTWTSVGSFDSVTVWSEGETKLMAATDASLGPFSHFKFVVKRVAGTATTVVTLSDVLLYSVPATDECSDGTHNCHANATCTDTAGSFTCACNSGFIGNGTDCTALIQLPPSDIGRGDTWTRDAGVTYSGGIYTLYKDYAGSVCPGRYRVRTNSDWANNPGSGSGSFAYNEWTPSGAFDRVEWASDSK